MLEFYIIVTADGKMKHSRCYQRFARACKEAKGEGDSVVKIAVSSSTQPVFIRGKIL